MADNIEEKGIRITIPQATIAALIIAILTWCWNVERRMSVVESTGDMSKRVENLENALLPILVDYKVRQEIEKNNMIPKIDYSSDIKETAEKWAQDRIPNVMNKKNNE